MNKVAKVIRRHDAMAAKRVEKAVQEECERIIKALKEIEKRRWNDAQHCTCLAYAIDKIEHPDD